MAVSFDFLHIGLNCDDPLKIERFYTKYFGFKRGRVYDPGPNQVVVINSGNLSFELFKAAKEAPFPPQPKDGPEWRGVRHIAFNVENVEAKLAEMGDDAKVSLGPIDFAAFVPGMTTTWIADPEGNIVELNQGYKDEENPPALPAE